ncbi:hypothetical protein D3C75_919020 [compost metagenome]
MAALTTQAHASAEAAQVTADQHDVSRCQGDVRTARAHGYTHHAGLERQGVVDPIADHHRPEAAVDFLEHAVEFVFGQGLRFDVADSDIPGERLCDAVSIAGEQQLATQTQLTQLTQGKLRLGFDAVGQQQPGKKLPIERQPGNRTIVIGNCRCTDAQLRKQLRPAERRFALPRHRHHTQALAFMNVGQQQKIFLGHQPRQGAADRMAAGRA